MSLFEECKEALSANFNILDGQSEKDVIAILNRYPFVNGNVSWSEIDSSDYESISDLLSCVSIKNDTVFVLVDDTSIPIFQTKLNLVAENIYDVTALSPKLFIFNNEIILQPLFPTEKIRLGIKKEDY